MDLMPAVPPISFHQKPNSRPQYQCILIIFLVESPWLSLFQVVIFAKFRCLRHSKHQIGGKVLQADTQNPAHYKDNPRTSWCTAVEDCHQKN
jgi:hypothetical protein